MAEFVEVMRQDARMRRTEESMDFLRRMDDLLSFDPARFEKAVMEDHIYDECRYVLMENPISPRKHVEPEPKPLDPLASNNPIYMR